MRISVCGLAAVAATLLSPLPAQGPKVIFLGAGSGADAAIQSYLEGRYGVANVTYQSTEPAGTVNAATILGYDVAVLSSTPSSARYRGILHQSTTAIVNLEEAVADNTPAGEFGVTTGRLKETETGPHAITITAAHPITDGFPVNSTVTITTGAAEVWWSVGLQAPGATSPAADDDTATNLFLTYVEVGDTLLNNTPAPCRRVMFGMTDFTFNFLNADGQKLFGQAVDWAAAGCCAQTSNYGAGLAGTNGIPSLTTSADPVFNTTINLLVENSSGVNAPGAILVGQMPAAVPFLGGLLNVVPVLEIYRFIPAAGAVIPLAIPDLAVLCDVAPQNLRFRIQSLQIDAAAPANVSMSRGALLRLGR